MTTNQAAFDEGCGRDWDTNDPQGLARFVHAREAGAWIQLPDRAGEAPTTPAGRRALARELYETLADHGVIHASELWDPDARCQPVRTATEVLHRPGNGTCLDLAVAYSALCLDVGLVPVIVMTRRHAFVLVSLDVGPDDYNARTRPQRNLFTRGPIDDPVALVTLIDDRRYLAIETTGYARWPRRPRSALRGTGGRHGPSAFDDALAGGRARFDDRDDPMRFALDIAATHGRGIGPRRLWPDRELRAGSLSLRATPDGLRADRSRPEGEPTELPAPAPPPPAAPTDLVGRDDAKERLLALAPGDVVTIRGLRGAGKSELLRWLAHEHSGPLGAGTILLAVDDAGPLDVLQRVFEHCYDARAGIQMTPSTVGRYLGAKSLRLLLDDWALDESATEVLHDALPASGLVVSATRPTPPGPAGEIVLYPLTPNEALVLFARAAEPLNAGEEAGLLAAFVRRDVTPRAVMVLTRSIRAGATTIAEVIDGAVPIGDAPLGELPSRRRLGQIIRAAHPAWIPRPRLAALWSESEQDLDAELDGLVADELVAEASRRYRWTGPHSSSDPAIEARLVDAVARWLDDGPVADEIVQEQALIRRSIEMALRSDRTEAAWAMARAAEPALAIGNRWDAWVSVLDTMDRLGDEAIGALVDHQAGTRALALGELDIARDRLQSAVARRRALGDHRGAELSRHNLGMVPTVPEPNWRG